MLQLQNIPIYQVTRLVSKQLPAITTPLIARLAVMNHYSGIPLNTMSNVRSYHRRFYSSQKQETTSRNPIEENESKEEEEFRKNVQSFWKKVDISAEETVNFIKKKDPVTTSKNYVESWWQTMVESAKEKEEAYYRQMEERRREYFLRMKEYYDKAAQETEFSAKRPEEPFTSNNAKEFGEQTSKWSNNDYHYYRFDKQCHKHWNRYEKSAKRSVIKVVLGTLFVGWLFAKLGFVGSIALAILFFVFTKRVPFWMMPRGPRRF